MGRSQETFSKKEKEKKKQKKKQDKEQKREERKSTSNKGKGMDEMLAYVDDEGNITSTPPDPKKKKIVKQEEIAVSVAKQEPLDPADLIHKGTVTYLNTEKGYGFIKDHETQERVFVHHKDFAGQLKENDKVSFEVEKGLKGLQAVKVTLIG